MPKRGDPAWPSGGCLQKEPADARAGGDALVSGCLGSNGDPADAGEPVGGNSVISSMTVAGARAALFLDVGDLAAGSHFAIPADNASASESGEAEKPDETHNAPRRAPSNKYAARLDDASQGASSQLSARALVDHIRSHQCRRFIRWRFGCLFGSLEKIVQRLDSLDSRLSDSFHEAERGADEQRDPSATVRVARESVEWRGATIPGAGK
jgi:hypothetical protein